MSLKSILGSIGNLLSVGAREGAETAIKEGDLNAGLAEAVEESAEEATGVDVDVEG